MGFLDNFKAAMERGAKAANDYCEREKAKQTQPVKKVQPKPADPSAPFKFVVRTDEAIEVTDCLTNDKVRFNILADGVAKLDMPSAFEGKDHKAILRQTVIETVTARLNDPIFFPNAKDLKTTLLVQNRLRTIVAEDLKLKGYSTAFKMFNITPVLQTRG